MTLLILPLCISVASAQAPDFNEAPLEAEEGPSLGEASLYGNHSVSGDWAVGTSNTALFGGMVQKLPLNVHYVYWRDGQYVYKLAYSQDLAYNGSRFVADSVEVVTYTTNNGYGSQATLSHGSESNFALSPGNYVVWSDLAHYPELTPRGEREYMAAAVFGLCAMAVYHLLSKLWLAFHGK